MVLGYLFQWKMHDTNTTPYLDDHCPYWMIDGVFNDLVMFKVLFCKKYKH